MKWMNKIVIGFLLGISLFACQNEGVKSGKGVGFLVLDVTTNVSLTSKASEYDPKVIGLKILDAEGTPVKEYDDWETIQGDKIPLKPGSYSIIASSMGYDGNVGIEKPYYVGMQTVDIVMGEASNVDIVCTLANVKVTAKFSENFLKVFGDADKMVNGSLVIKSTDGTQKVEPTILDIQKGNAGVYYFPVTDLSWNVTVHNQSSQTILDYSGEVTEVKEREHIVLNFKTKEDLSGKVDVDLVIDESLNKYEYTISVPSSQSGTATTLTTEDANSWTSFAKLSGVMESKEEIDPSSIVFKYRERGIAAWNAETIPAVKEGSKYTAILSGLTPATTYEYCLSNTKVDGNIVEFTTETKHSLPENDFENWWLDGKVWMMGTKENPFWDSGNEGAATLGAGREVAYWDEANPHGGSKSGKLISRYVLIKFAAGNLFAGDYLATEGTDGALSFGRPFESRPSQFKGWFKYNQGSINSTPTSAYPNTPAEAKKGNPDKGKIYIALGDWDPQVLAIGSKRYDAIVPIRTSSKNQMLFDVNDSHIIAYGEKVIDSTVSDWTEFAIDLAFRSDRKPKYIVIVMTSSIYGDYFVGSDSSVLWVDDLSLEYPDAYPSIEN